MDKSSDAALFQMTGGHSDVLRRFLARCDEFAAVAFYV
jgi:hypothetical protein